MMAFYKSAKIANFKKRGRKKMDRFFLFNKTIIFLLVGYLIG